MPNILIVDDEASLRLLLASLLEEDGYTVKTATSVPEAREYLRSQSFDVVLTDIILPRIHGTELLPDLTRNTKAIMMTGEPTIETAVKAVRAGAFDYLPKPFTKEALLKVVGNATTLKSLEDDRDRLEKLNQEHQRELERRVVERTRELDQALAEIKLSQDRLIQQEKLKALGQMVSGIAHDLNNILMPVLGLPEFMLANPKMIENPKEVERALTTIMNAAHDAQDIISRLRNFYRPDLKPGLAPCSPSTLITQAIALTEPSWKSQAEAAGKTITIRTEFQDVPNVLINESTMRQVLTNLIMNSVDAIAAEGTITFSTDRDDPWVIIRVSDTGHGMTEKVRQQCFDPFFTTKGEQGSGLGLPVSYSLIQQNGGTLEVESEAGKGTTIILRLLSEQLAPLPDSAQAVPPPSALEEGVLSPLRILVVDDDPVSRNLLMEYITAMGHVPELAENGTQALTLLRQIPFDIVLTDRAMPGMRGDEVAKLAKRISPGIPVIMLTGFGSLMRHTQERPEGVDEIIEKPVSPAALDKTIKSISRTGAPS